MSGYRLAIKESHTREDRPCALCGEPISVQVPLALFMADSWRPVCEKCGMHNAPALVRTLGLVVMAEEATFALYPWVVAGNMAAGVDNDEC